jgi:hypothetical protein
MHDPLSLNSSTLYILANGKSNLTVNKGSFTLAFKYILCIKKVTGVDLQSPPPSYTEAREKFNPRPLDANRQLHPPAVHVF